MPKLTIMSGVAGSGKSTWAHKQACGNYNCVVLSTDEMRQLFFHTQYPNRRSEAFIRKIIVAHAIEASKCNTNVIIDTAVVKNKSILKWWRKLNQYFDETELVIMDTTLETCLKQNQMRDRHVPEDVIREMFTFREPISEEIKRSFTSIQIIREDK